MPPLTTVDSFIDRICDGFEDQLRVYGHSAVTRVSLFGGASSIPQIFRAGFAERVPDPLPAGVSAYVPTELSWHQSLGGPGGRAILVAELIDLGSIDISGASGTFTDGATMPTRDELGVSRQIDNAVIIDVETALNATPGSIAITFTDPAGGSVGTGALVMGASCPVSSAGFVPLGTGVTGARDITAATRTGGTTPTGVLRFWGVLPIGIYLNGAVPTAGLIEPLWQRYVFRRLGAGARIGLFGHATFAASAGVGTIRMIGDTV